MHLSCFILCVVADFLPGGETIKDMQNTTGCKINVSQQSGPGEMDREIGLVGSRDSIEQAKRAIEEKVDVVVSLFATDMIPE